MNKEISALLEKCYEKGICLWTEGEKLKFKAPKGVFTPDLKDKIKENKLEVTEYINSLENESISADFEHINEPFLLTEVQSSYLIGRNDFYEYGGIGCHAYVEAEIPRCDISKMQQAFNKVVDMHPMLKAVVTKDGYQRILKDFEYPVILENAQGDNLQTEVLKARKRLEQKNYDCEKPPLYDIFITTVGDKSVVHFSMDMLLADSVSMGIILNDLLDLYNGKENKKAPEISFRDVILFNEVTKNKPSKRVKRDEDRAYWADKINTLPDAPHVPMCRDEEEKKAVRFELLEFTLCKEKWQSFSQFANKNMLTPSAAVMAVYAGVINAWSANDSFCLNVTTMLRPDYHKDINKIVGDFTSNTILEVNCDNKSTFTQSTADLQKRLWENIEHSEFSGIEVLREVNRRKKYTVMMPFVYTSTLGIENLDSDEVNILYKSSQTPQVFIDCQVGETRGNLSVVWTLRKGSVDEKAANIMFESFCKAITELSENEKAWNETFDANIPDGEKEFYENSLKALAKKEEEWIIKYADVDEKKCESILNGNLEIEDSAVINGDKVNVYILPKENENDDYFKACDEKIKKLNKEETQRLCGEVKSDDLLCDIKLADDFAALDIMRTFRGAGAFLSKEEKYSLKELEIMLCVSPDYKYLLERWLKALEREGFICEENGKYRALITDVDDRYGKIKEKLKKMTLEKPGYKGMENYLVSSGEKLADSISGKINPVEFLFPKGETQTAHAIYHDLFAAKMLNMLCLKTIEAVAKKGDKIKVLEVGSGVGGTSDDAIPFLADYKNVEYYFTDISQYFLQEARKKYEKYDFVKYAIYDLNEPCENQGIKQGDFDFIISANTFHNAVDGYAAMKTMKKALKPNGYIIFLDCIFESNSLLTSKGMLHHGEIKDSRLDDKRIFFTDEEWQKMIESADMEIADTYPMSDDFFAKFNLKYYAVRNKKQYKEVCCEDVYNLISGELRSKEKLGEIVVSPEIELNAQGKIEKNSLKNKNLKFKKAKSKGKSDMPSTKLEEEIAKIWQEIFEADDMPGVNESFFELGGDSLLASMTVTKMRSRIKSAQKAEWNDLMNILLKNNTVKKLAAAIEGLDEKQDVPDFVMIYQKESENPENVWAFFVNGTATMPIYQRLFEVLSEKISENDAIVGLHCGNPVEFLKLEEDEVIDCMAKRNCEYLLGQKAKKYHLVGHCFGGGVAIETARLMKEAGENSVCVATIDTKRLEGKYDNDIFFEKGFGEMYGADMTKCGYEFDDELLKNTMREFEEKNKRFLTSEEMCVLDEVPSEIRSCYKKLKAKSTDQRISDIFALVENKLPGGFDENVFKNSYYMFAKILSAFMAYKPKKYDGKVDAFLCIDQSGFFMTGDIESLDYAKKAVWDGGNRIWTEGDHFTCMETPNIEKIAEILVGE